MNDSDFLAAFSACRLDSIDHKEHVRLAWIVLKEKSLLQAIEWLVDGFSAFAKSKGKPEVYHETITWAFTVLINERMERSGRDNSWEQFVIDNPDLFRGRALLEELYKDCTLESELAQSTFLLPDRFGCNWSTSTTAPQSQ